MHDNHHSFVFLHNRKCIELNDQECSRRVDGDEPLAVVVAHGCEELVHALAGLQSVVAADLPNCQVIVFKVIQFK